MREVLPTMQPRYQAKGHHGQDLQTGDVVINVDESLSHVTRPHARINKLYPG